MHVFEETLYLACIINMKSVPDDSPSLVSNGSVTEKTYTDELKLKENSQLHLKNVSILSTPLLVHDTTLVFCVFFSRR